MTARRRVGGVLHLPQALSCEPHLELSHNPLTSLIRTFLYAVTKKLMLVPINGILFKTKKTSYSLAQASSLLIMLPQK
jgi:hypothetical protein